MANVRFYLKTSKGSNPERLILLYYTYNGNRFKYSTGLSVHPDQWNPDKQQVREIAKFDISLSRQYNERLRELSRTVEKIQLERLNQGEIITPDELRAELNNIAGRSKESKAKGLFAFIEEFIDTRDASPKYKVESIKVYRALYGKMTEYAKSKRKARLDFTDITPEFWVSLRDFLYNLGLSENTVHKQITTLKTLLNAAKESTYYGEEATKAYLIPSTRKIGVSKEAVQKIYLNMDELKHLYDMDLSNNERLDRVRDLFLIGAFTGLRFSDFTRIHPDHITKIDGQDVIRIDTKKTGERVVIPIHPYVKAILAKYGGKPPKGISNQRMNSYLKELGKEAEMDEPFIVTKKIGGEKTSDTFKKYELICTHTARRSFATNTYKEGVPTLAIMQITGHRTEASFMRYIQVTKEENAVLLAKNNFFK
ncbi:MAG: site-specific integrase [Saprospiraceae bacterium]|nr:site-specific integrase [Saprospiraceae bacterium]